MHTQHDKQPQGAAPAHQWSDAGLARLLDAIQQHERLCISCGAKPNEHGELPCMH